MIFLDTSAIYALADQGDDQHQTAVSLFEAVVQSGRTLLTHNYVLVECAALLHKRLGRESAMAFHVEARQFRVHWVSPDLHAAALEYLRTQGPSKLSLVDAVSFIVMKDVGLEEYLAFDGHFAEAGFRLVSLQAGGEVEPGHE